METIDQEKKWIKPISSNLKFLSVLCIIGNGGIFSAMLYMSYKDVLDGSFFRALLKFSELPLYSQYFLLAWLSVLIGLIGSIMLYKANRLGFRLYLFANLIWIGLALLDLINDFSIQMIIMIVIPLSFSTAFYMRRHQLR